MSDLGDRIVKQARYYVELQVPFYHCGRNRYGMDCVGLLAVVAHDLGITDYDDTGYQPDPPAEELTRVLEAHCDRVWDARSPILSDVELEYGCKPGDLLQFDITGQPRHCGIFARDEQRQPTMIHCWESVGKVTEHLFDKAWRRRLWAVYRVRERS